MSRIRSHGCCRWVHVSWQRTFLWGQKRRQRIWRCREREKGQKARRKIRRHRCDFNEDSCSFFGQVVGHSSGPRSYRYQNLLPAPSKYSRNTPIDCSTFSSSNPLLCRFVLFYQRNNNRMREIRYRFGYVGAQSREMFSIRVWGRL